MELREDLLQTCRDAWVQEGLDPVEVLDVNAFGNVLLGASDGSVWRICPEELTLAPVADSPEDFETVWARDEFRAHWGMKPLVELAESCLGPCPAGRCYCLRIPGVLGGAYEAENLATIDLRELIAASGDMARQIRDLPNGATVRLVVRD